MRNDKKVNLSEEHLRKIMYRTNYKVNESPRYRPLVNDGEEFDEIPMLEAGDQEDAPIPGGGEVPTEPTLDEPMNAGGTPVPAFDSGSTEMGGGVPGEPMPPANPEMEVNTIQNDIIKHNIEAMKGIHDELKSLENSVNGLNAEFQKLNADVEEVREPTNSEKLMNKSKVSYPYYFNLNDFWDGNWFSQQREKELSKGIKEMPDGTFVADFDDLPQASKTDIQNSFSEIYETVNKKKKQQK